MIRVTDKVLQEFEALCDLEPRLRELQFEAMTFQANSWEDAWFGRGARRKTSIRMRLAKLVGFNAGYEDETPNTLGIEDSQEAVFLTVQDLLHQLLEGTELKQDFPSELRTSRAYDVVYSVLLRDVRAANPRCVESEGAVCLM